MFAPTVLLGRRQTGNVGAFFWDDLVRANRFRRHALIVHSIFLSSLFRLLTRKCVAEGRQYKNTLFLFFPQVRGAGISPHVRKDRAAACESHPVSRTNFSNFLALQCRLWRSYAATALSHVLGRGLLLLIPCFVIRSHSYRNMPQSCWLRSDGEMHGARHVVHFVNFQ